MFLKNGLKLIKIPKEGSQTFLIGFVVSTGLLVEIGYFPKGINELIRLLFWQGTDKYNSTKQLNLILESLGGTFRSFVQEENTHFYLTVPSYNQYKAISFLADIIQHSYFDVQDITKQKQLIYNYREAENAGEEVSEIFARNLFLQDFGSTFIENVLQINHDDVVEYLSHQYQTSRSTLVLAGNFEDKQISELVSQEWEFWNPKSQKFVESTSIFSPDFPQLPQFLYRQKGTSFTQVSFAFVLDNPSLFPKNTEENEEENSPNSQNNFSNSDNSNNNASGFFKFPNRSNTDFNDNSSSNFNDNFANNSSNSDNFQDFGSNNSQASNPFPSNSQSSHNYNQNNSTSNSNFGSSSSYSGENSNSNNLNPNINNSNIINRSNLNLSANLTRESDFEKDYDDFLFNWAKLYLLNTILGQGLSSRLWTKCVEEEMLMETVESKIVNFSCCGYFGINTTSENTQFSFGLESVLQILESLKKTTVSINELSKAKEFLRGKLILEHEDLFTSTVWHVEQNLFSDFPVLLEDLLAVIPKIQAAEIRALACDLFVSSKLSLLIMGPNKELRLIERLIDKYLS